MSAENRAWNRRLLDSEVCAEFDFGIFHSKCGLFDFVCCICRSAGDANSLYFVYSSRLFGYCIPNEHRKQSCQYRRQLDLPGGRLVGCWMCGTAGVAKGCPRLFQIRTLL